MRFWLADLVGIILTGALVAVGTVDPEAAQREAKEAAAPSNCERYGEMTDCIVEARFPEPKDESGPAYIAHCGGYNVMPMALNAAPIPKVSWWCDGEQLTVRVTGPWIFDAADMPSALDNLLQELRDGAFDPQEDAVGIVLNAVLLDGSARFDPANACTHE